MRTGVAGIDHGTNDTVRVDDERGARVVAFVLLIDAVEPPGLVPRPVAEQRNLQFEMLGEVRRSRETIDAHTQNLGAGREELVLEPREARKFLVSAAGERQRVECEHDRPATIVAERDRAALAVWQREIGRRISDLRSRHGTPRLHADTAQQR